VTTLARLWESVVEMSPHRTAVRDIDGLDDLDFAALWARIQATGGTLLGSGLMPGDRVGILSGGFTRQYLELEQGVMVAGLVRVPIDPASSPEDIQAQLAHAEARALVFDPELEGLARGVEDVELKLELDSGFARLVDGNPGAALPAPQPHDLASLNFTGGTTGAPKAVALTHRNLATVVRAVNSTRMVSPDDLLLNVRPMWPISGVLVAIHLLAGSTVGFAAPFDARTFPDEVERSAATVTSLVPTMLVRLLAESGGSFDGLRSLRTIDIGAAGVPRHRLEEAVSKIGPIFGTVYGLTEAPWTCYRPPNALFDDDGSLVPSVGWPVGDHRVSIEDEAGEMPLGETGEIIIAGDHVMTGYWKDVSATSDVLVDGRFHTGDLGRLDRRGRLHVVGRTREIIRTGGRSVEPNEVEAVILGLPGVTDAAVVGLPSDEWGEEVVAAVVSTDPGLTEAEVVRACRAALASYKKPRRVRFVESLPRSHYGKVLRSELRDILIAQEATGR
jgi:acyl-CoA synthetase (AMP-forming)/AMP-acid ligase II